MRRIVPLLHIKLTLLFTAPSTKWTKKRILGDTFQQIKVYAFLIHFKMLSQGNKKLLLAQKSTTPHYSVPVATSLRSISAA
jgi:hypothetical protein